MNKSNDRVKPRNCPSGLYQTKRGWATRLPGKKNLVFVAGINAPFEQVLAKFHEKQAQGRAVKSEPFAKPVQLVQSVPVPPAPVQQVATITVEQLKTLYVAHIESLHRSGRYANASLRSMWESLPHFVGPFSKYSIEQFTPADFAKYRETISKLKGGKSRSVYTINNRITTVKAMFNWGVKNYHIPFLPKYGSAFDICSAAELRHHQERTRRTNGGLRFFDAVQVKLLLDKADTRLKALILLGLNGGFGNNDLATLPTGVVDLANGIIEYPRPKNGIQRKCTLWDETVKAIREWQAIRPNPAKSEFKDLLFLTKIGTPMAQSFVSEGKVTKSDYITQTFRVAAKSVGVWREGLSFYSLRHTFMTFGAEMRDSFHLARISGHKPRGGDPEMMSVYVEKVEVSNLRRITDHIRSMVLKDWIAPQGEIFGEVQRPPLDLDD